MPAAQVARVLTDRSPNRGTKRPFDPVGAEEKPARDDKYAPAPPEWITDPTDTMYKTGPSLGKGGFAVCYQATAAMTGRDGTRRLGKAVALKIVKTAMSATVEGKFRAELQIHSKMDHPNIVKFYRAFTLAESTFVVLGLCKNGSLKEMWENRGKKLSQPEVRRFTVQLCGGLTHLHNRGVIHRDIKLANVLLDDDMNLKIADFGLAGILVPHDVDGNFVRRVTLCGTPNYIAPEVLQKNTGHDEKADIWSLGALLYTLLVGFPPFYKAKDSKTTKELFQRVLNGSWKWPAESLTQLSAECRSLVESLLQQDDTLRPTAAKVVRHEFFRSGSIPARIDVEALHKQPTWLTRKYPREMKATEPTVDLAVFAAECQVDVETDSANLMWKALQQDEETGKTVRLPLDRVFSYSKLQSTTIKAQTVRKQPTSAYNREFQPYFICGTPHVASLLDPRPCDHIGKVHLLVHVFSLALDQNPNTHYEPMYYFGQPTPRITNYRNDGKYGVGYTLEDGTIGVFLRDRDTSKARLVIVEKGLEHARLKKNTLATYAHRGQIVPPERNVTFVERCTKCEDSQLHVFQESSSIHPTSASGKMRPGADAAQHERRVAVVKWSSFGSQLLSTLDADSLARLSRPTPDPPASQSPAAIESINVPILYQRLGNVTLFMHVSGSLQVFFPDNTSFHLDSKGTFLSMTHPSLSTLDTSSTSFGTHSLFPSHAPSSPDIQTTFLPLILFLTATPKFNASIFELVSKWHVREKIEFLRTTLKIWIREGGIGKMGREKIKWVAPGARSEGEELEWDVLSL